ncbi:MAG: hypothetical protein AAB932_00465, partial [Patescibacteria group bacterium]
DLRTWIGTIFGGGLGVDAAARRVDPKAERERKKEISSELKTKVLPAAWELTGRIHDTDPKDASALPPARQEEIHKQFADLLGYLKSNVLADRPDLHGALTDRLSALAPYEIALAKETLHHAPLEQVIAHVTAMNAAAGKKAEAVKKEVKRRKKKDFTKVAIGGAAGALAAFGGELGVHQVEELWAEYMSWLTAVFPLKGRSFRAPNPTIRY